MMLAEHPLTSHLRTLSVLVVHLILTDICRGQLIGASQPIIATLGDDIILPCHLEPAEDLTGMTLEWSRPDLEPRFVYVWRSGLELEDNKHKTFKGRTTLFTEELQHGNISLKLNRVKLSDKGTYRCYIPTLEKQTIVHLVVGSASPPVISLAGMDGDTGRVVLQCESSGWYPEPELLWLDGDGNLLCAGPTETVRGPDDLYTVSSRVTVEKKHNNKFTCRVQQNNINQTRETWIHVSADLFMVHSNLSARITTTMAACVLTIAVVVFIVWKLGQTRTKKQEEDETELGERKMRMISNDVELELLMEGHRDREQSMLGSEKMKMKKEKISDELQKSEEELEHVQQVIKVFKEQKEVLNNQREKLLSLQQKEKTKVEEIEMKKVSGLDKKHKKKKRDKAKEEATQKNREHEELLENTTKLLKTTEEMIEKMTERKGKLEKNKEQITKRLKSTEQEIEELQKKLEESKRKEDKDNQSLDKQTTEHQQERTQVEINLAEEQNNPS